MPMQTKPDPAVAALNSIMASAPRTPAVQRAYDAAVADLLANGGDVREVSARYGVAPANLRKAYGLALKARA